MFAQLAQITLVLVFVALSLSAIWALAKLGILNSENNHMLVRLKELKDELAYKDATILEIKCNSLRLELQLEEKEKDLKTIGEIKTDMLAQFKNISNEIVEIQKENFTREQKRDLASILDPLKKQISDFDLRVQRTIQDNNESTAKTEAALREHIGLLVKHTENVGVKADNLANVLRNDRKAQGNFGELQLENLLESIGLREGTDYLKQQYVKNREGEQFFLDFLINMPGQRKLVIDSKVSLVNYENYRGTKDEMERDGFMRMYCADIRKHIEELGKKKYHELHGPGSLDFVFMFLPFEGAYLEAMDYDRDLFNIAFKNGVAMVTGSSLMPVLRMIENLWSVEKQSKNIEAIVRLAMCMYEKILKFLGSMNAVKSGLDNAQKSYEKAMDYISRGRGNVLKVVNDIRVLSGKEKTTGEIPTEYEDVDFRGHIVPLPDTQDK